jgi:peptide/nickel transport system permease protein
MATDVRVESPVLAAVEAERRSRSAWARLPGVGKAGFILLFLLLLATWLGPLFYRVSPDAINYLTLNAGMSAAHPLGTDMLGRDVLSRVLNGGRITIAAAFATAVAGGVIGLILGAVAGLWSIVDLWLMRLIDVWLSFPFLVLAIALVATLGPSVIHACIAVTIAIVPGFVRLVRGEVLRLKNLEFVEAGRAMGAGAPRVITRHLLPNLLPLLVTYAPVQIGGIVLAIAALSFLGLGASPPSPEWGAMVYEGQGYLLQSWLPVIAPGAAIFLLVIALNLIGDGMRQVLQRGRSR